MFTIEQIDDIHARLGSARTFTEYVQALKHSASNGTILTSLMAIRSTSGRMAIRSSPHRCTRFYPSLRRVNARCSLSTCAGTSGARRLT
jgi:hypothetical protein